MDYKGIVATIIAGTLGTSVMISVIALAWRNGKLGEVGGQVLISTVSGMLVALGYYMGKRDD